VRCPDCDRYGEVLNPDPGDYNIECPRCGGTRKVEGPAMNEEDMYRWLMITAAVLAALCGLGAVGLIILCAAGFSWGVLLCSILLTGGAIGSGYTTVYFSTKTTVPKVFNNQDEREVLTNKQRKILKTARGEVVMERAMIEVEHERENIIHNLELTAADPDKPPHVTRWSEEVRNAIGGKVLRMKDEEERR
jgi:membrane protein implicated in regulation of membrane protease activity